VKPIDKLTGSDFFPDVIGMKEHFAFSKWRSALSASWSYY
jgi:hypothetical protein